MKAFLYADISLRDHLLSIGYIERTYGSDPEHGDNVCVVWPLERAFVKVYRRDPPFRVYTCPESLEAELVMIKLCL